MANDLFGGLGGLMKGLSTILPQDDPNVKLMTAKTDLSSLQAKENEAYAEIGRLAAASQGLSTWPEQAERIQSLQLQMKEAQTRIDAASAEKSAKEKAEQQTREAHTCPECGAVHDEGVSFCSECGAKLGVSTIRHCPQCGAENPVGGRFCGGCGARLD